MYSTESMSDSGFGGGGRWFTPETCLLCDRKRNQVDPGEFTSRTYFLKSPCWICATCKGSNTYDNTLDEQDERNLASVMSHVLNPRDLFDLSSSIQSSEHNEDSEDVDESFFPLPTPGSSSSSSATSTGEPILVDDCCNCSSCNTLRELEKMSKDSADSLKKSWDEVKAEVEKLYREMLIEGKQKHYFRDFCKIRTQVDKLCVGDPHLLFRRLEAQVTECVIEVKVRLLHKLTSGPKTKTPSFCLDFVDRLMTDFKQLNLAAEQMSDLIKTLEQDHLSLFKMTWAMHNKNQFRVLCWDEPLIRNSLKAMLMGLTEGCSGCPIYPREKYISLYKEYIEFTEEMTVMSVLWGETQRLVDVFQDTQARNEIRARNLTQEIDAFHYDRLLWHQRISQFSDSKAFMSLYTSILAEEADHHEQMLQNLGYKSQPPATNSSSTGSQTTGNHETEVEVKTNEKHTPQNTQISNKNLKSSTSTKCQSNSANAPKITSVALRKDEPGILNGSDVDADLEPPPVNISTSHVKLSDYLDNIHPPSVPSSDSECSDNDSDSPPKIFERPNLNYLNWTDLLDLPDNYDCFAGYEDSEKEDAEIADDASADRSKKKNHANSGSQKEGSNFDDDDDSHYHHADQPSTSSQAKLSPRATNSSDCSTAKKGINAFKTQQCTNSKNAESSSSENKEEISFCKAQNLPLKERKENITGLLQSLNNGTKQCKNLGNEKQEREGVKRASGSGGIVDPIVGLDNLFEDDNDPCECPVCNSRGRTADELFADDDDDDEFDFLPIKPTWKEKLDGDIDDITERLSKLCPVPSMGPNDMPLPLLSSVNRTSHQSSILTNESTTDYQEKTTNKLGMQDNDDDEERRKEKFIDESKSKPLPWDTDLLTKSLRDYIGQLHARKIATENRIKRENDNPTVLGICTDVVPPPQLSKNTNKGSDSVASEEDSKSGDAESESPTYQQQISAIEFNIYGYEGLEMTKSFRMPIPDVDSSSEADETESPRTWEIEGANSSSPSQKRKKLKQNSAQSNQSSEVVETGKDKKGNQRTSESKCKASKPEPESAPMHEVKASKQKNQSSKTESLASHIGEKDSNSKPVSCNQKDTTPEPATDSKMSQTPTSATKQSGQSNTFKKGFLNSLSTSKKSNVETSASNNSKTASNAIKSVAMSSEGSAESVSRESAKKSCVETSNAKHVTESVECNKNAKHRSHIHFSSKQNNVSKRMQMSPKTISLTYTAPAKYESPNSNKICAKIDLVPANRPVGLGKMRTHGSPPSVTSSKGHVDSSDLENGHGSTVVSNGGCKNTDKCHCFLGSACIPATRSREDDMREKLRRKLDVKQNVSPKNTAESTVSQKKALKLNETGSPAKTLSSSNGKTNPDSGNKNKDSVLSSTKSANAAADNGKRDGEKKKSKDSKLSSVTANQDKMVLEKENVDMSKLPIDKLAAYIEGTDYEADKPKKSKKSKKKKQKENDASQSVPAVVAPVVQEKPNAVASTSKVSKANDVTHQNGSGTAKTGAGTENNSHSPSPEPKSYSKKSSAKTTKVPLASGEEKKPRAKNDSFVSLDSEEIFMPRDNLDGLDEGEKELEMFKRFCMDAKPRDEKPRKKICLNVKDIVKKT